MKIQIDWFQLYARGEIINNNEFIRTPTGIKSKTFAKIDEFHHQGRHIATIAYKPHSPIIKPDAHIIKFSNEILYSSDFIKFFIQIGSNLGLQLRNITRIDLCFDFNNFLFFRDPENLIKDFFTGKLIYQRPSLFKIIGTTNFNVRSDYLRFGSNLSILSAYLYRKSLEMKQKVFKPYIYKQWKSEGLDTTKDVWRLEFSLKGGEHNVASMESGETFKIEIDQFLNDKFLYDFYFSLVKQYFNFYKHDKKSKYSKGPEIVLFNYPYNPFKHYIQPESKDLNRSDKIFIKKFEEFNQELRDNKPEFYQTAIELVDYFANLRGLREYKELKTG